MSNYLGRRLLGLIPLVGERTVSVARTVATQLGAGFSQTTPSQLSERASAAVREKAREHVLAHYDMKAVCLPAHLALIRRLTGEPPAPRRRSRRAAPTRQAVSA